MRFAVAAAAVVALLASAGTPALAVDGGSGLAAEAAVADEQQPQGVAQPAEPGAEEMTSAGIGNILWIVIAVVAAVAFVGLALIGLRSSTRE